MFFLIWGRGGVWPSAPCMLFPCAVYVWCWARRAVWVASGFYLSFLRFIRVALLVPPPMSIMSHLCAVFLPFVCSVQRVSLCAVVLDRASASPAPFGRE